MQLLELTEEYEELRHKAHSFAENEIRPVARDYNQRSEYPRDIIRKAADEGFVADMIPKKYGGAGRDMLGSAIVTEEMWRGDPAIGFAIDLASFTTNVYILSSYADELLKEEWLPKIAAGEIINSIAVTEPNHGSNVGGLETTATKDGDEWVINGHKKFIGNATVADLHLVLAKTDPGAAERGLSAFIVPADTAGVTGTRIEEKMGMHATDWGELKFEDVRISEDHLVGEKNQAFFYFMESLARGRTTVAAEGVGVSQAALEAARSYATEREQFEQQIADFQAIRHKLAEMATDTEVARAIMYRAAKHTDEETDRANQLASMAKLAATETSIDVTDEAVQVFGGAGYLAENDVERYYRDARATKIYEGTSEIQKNIIAKEFLTK